LNPLKRLIFAIILIIIPIVLLESSLRLLNFYFHIVNAPHLYVWNPYTYYALRPNWEGEVEGEWVKIGDHGLKNGPFSTKKERGTYRILCIGDSVTFGWGMPTEASYPRTLERALRDHPGGRFEVINGGMPGFQSAQVAALLSSRFLDIEPDLLVVCLGRNDVHVLRGNTMKALTRVFTEFGYNHFDWRDGKLFIHPLGQMEREIGIKEPVLGSRRAMIPLFPVRYVERSMIYKFMLHIMGKVMLFFQNRVMPSSETFLFKTSLWKGYYRNNPEVMARMAEFKAKEEDISHVTNAYEAHVKSILHMAKERDVKVILVSQPHRYHREFFDVMEDEDRETAHRAFEALKEKDFKEAMKEVEGLALHQGSNPFVTYLLGLCYIGAGRREEGIQIMEGLERYEFFSMQAMTARIATEYDIPFVDSVIEFQESKDDLYLFDRTHPNGMGCKVISDAIVETMESHGWLSEKGDPL